MKKFLALALALVMALALAAPAMAFTNDVAAEYEYTLSVELVEFENDEFFGLVGYAPSDRGYAKNEIVAFIVSYTAEKGGNAAEYGYLKVTGANVTFDVTDNANAKGFAAYSEDEMTGNIVIDAAKLEKANQSVKFLGFAKVTGDDASITAEATAKATTAGTAKFNGEGILVVEAANKKVYTIEKDGYDFIVSKGKGAAAVKLFKIDCDKTGATVGLYVYEEGTSLWKVLKNNADKYLFVNSGSDLEPDSDNETKAARYDALVAIVEDVFAEVFGFDYDLLGGVVTAKYFEGLASYDALSYTVDIAPWVAYVQVPDIIVVDPPKTGDATVLVGIVMAIVAAAGVVVFNKVRA